MIAPGPPRQVHLAKSDFNKLSIDYRLASHIELE
jgi:hypothetical protein